MAEVTIDLRAIQARVDLATRALPEEAQREVFDLVTEAHQAGRESAARDIESTVIAGQKVPDWAFPGGTPTAEGLRTWAAAIARGDA